MRSTITCGIIAITISSFTQLCPAPPVVIAAAITAAGAIIGGGVSSAKRDVSGLYEYDAPNVRAEKPVELRDAVPVDMDATAMKRDTDSTQIPPGVPKQDYNRCITELKSASVTVTGPIQNHGIQADGVPPTCMTLATVLVGNPVKGPYPTPCGSACLLYNNLTEKQYNKLRNIFLQHS